MRFFSLAVFFVGCVGSVETAPAPVGGCAQPLGLEAAAATAVAVPPLGSVELGVRASRCGAPATGVEVSFESVSGSLSAPSASTDAQGLASVTLRAGSTAGAIEVTARAEGHEVKFSVSIAAVDDAVLVSATAPASLACGAHGDVSVTMKNTGSTTWTGDDCALGTVPLPSGAVEPGASVTFDVPVQAAASSGALHVNVQMHRGGTPFGPLVARDVPVSCGCAFPQGLPESDFIAMASSLTDTDPAVDAAVNAAMEAITGCSALSRCPLMTPGATTDAQCQSWFAAVTDRLRAQGFCAGQHELGSTDEIAVSNTGCTGKWYGYHVCNYGGPVVVWNPGARRGWWQIAPERCAP